MKLEILKVASSPIKDTIPYINKFNGLVVYGTKDEVFNDQLVKHINIDEVREVVEIPNANHSLESNHVAESIEILGRIVRIYMNFINK